MPSSTKIFLDRDPLWGVYREDGSLVPEAAYERLPLSSRELVGQSWQLDLSGVEIVDAPFEEMVYAGPIIGHYGHFILTSLARLWAVDGSRPVLFHSHPPVFEHGARFIVEMLAAAGLTPSNACSFDRPTRIRRLIVPEASFFEQVYTTREYSAAAAKIGAAIPESGRFQSKDYYISKSRIHGGVARLAGEEVIEREFQNAGFEIVYPETLGLADQVSLFRNARTIAGTISSAFHTVALAPEGTGRHILFDYQSSPNANFPLLDYGTKADVSYYSINDMIRREQHDRFLAHFVAHDIDALAKAMVRIARAPFTRKDLYEMSGGDYVSWVGADGKVHTDLPAGVPDEDLSQFARSWAE